MTSREMETVLWEELDRIAPDIDMMDVDLDADTREEFDIDSMDFLNLITALSKRLNISMPETDYDQMMSFNNLVGYLENKTDLV